MPVQAPTDLPSSARKLVRAVAMLGALGLTLSVVNGTLGLGSTFSDYGYPLTYLPAAMLCLLRARYVARERVAWAAFGTGFLLWAGGYAYYGAEIHHAEAPPFPSIADALWLSFYPVVYLGLIALLRARVRDFRGSFWLDGLLGALALGALGGVALVHPILAATDGNTVAAAATFAYPLGDLALLVVVITVGAVMSWRPGSDWLLIAVALLVQICADAIYVRQSVTGGYEFGTLLDSSWVLLSLLVAWAAWHRPAARTGANVDGWRALVVPSLFTAAALLLLVLGNFEAFEPHVSDISAFLAAGALAVFAVRAGLTFKEKQHLGKLASRDPLTGLLNHGAFHAAVDAEIERCGDSDDERFAVVMLDLDGFKEVNDLRGHAEGDRVLRTVAQVIGETPRASDVTGRVGGDEFAMLLRGLDVRGATNVAERVRKRILEWDLGIDVSYGIGEWPADGPSKGMTLLRADTALYAAKAERDGSVRAGDAKGSQRHLSRARSRKEEAERARALERAQLRTYAEDVRESYARELQRTEQLKESYLATVRTLAAAVEAKDDYTGGHIQRVHSLGLLLAGEIAPGDAADAQLSYGFLLHDIGKLAVPDAVLNKPGKLTDEEWELMKLHPEQGASILASVPFLDKALDVVRHHHERWDGSGYPDGLSEAEIPLWARIFAVVDAVDAITSDRPYRRGLPLDVAVAELRKGAGTQFDPACVEAFERLDRTQVEAMLQHGRSRPPGLHDVSVPDHSLTARR